MYRTVGLYAALLVVALIAAYFSWTSKPESTMGSELKVLDIERKDLVKVVYRSKGFELTLEPKRDEIGDYIWGTYRREVRKPKGDPRADALMAKRPSAPKPADGDKAKPPAADEPKPTPLDKASRRASQLLFSAERKSRVAAANKLRADAGTVTEERKGTFKAGESADKLIERYTPFRALRTLTMPSDKAKLAEMGFVDPEAIATLEVHVQGTSAPRVFEVGGEGFGHRNNYVRDKDKGTLYLMDSNAIRPLKFGDSRLPERDLLGIKERDVVRVEVASEKGTLALEQFNRDDPEAAYWAKSQGDKPDATAKTWLAKVFKLTSAGFESEAPKGAKVVVAVALESEKGKRFKLEVLSAPGKEGQTDWFARSAHLRGTVRLFRRLGQDLSDDLNTLLTAAPN